MLGAVRALSMERGPGAVDRHRARCSPHGLGVNDFEHRGLARLIPHRSKPQALGEACHASIRSYKEVAARRRCRQSRTILPELILMLPTGWSSVGTYANRSQ
jgi:hypothetical protein